MQHFITKYGHLNKIHVSVGQRVSKSQQIGTLGNTGISTGPHLHYEIHDMNRRSRWPWGRTVDPAKYITHTAANLSQSCSSLREKAANEARTGDAVRTEMESGS